MANTTRKVYSSLFLKIVEKFLVTLGENEASKESTGVVFFNNNWEGDIAQRGATVVNIPVEGNDPTVRNYIIATGIAPENIEGKNLQVIVTGSHAINELLDGYEVKTVPAKVVARRLQRSAKAFAKKIDDDGITTLEASPNILKAGADLTKANAYEKILDGITKGMEDSITFAGLITTPKVYKLIKLDPSFTKNSDMGMAQAKNGRVGFIDSIPVVVSNKLDPKTQVILVDYDHATRIKAFEVGPKLVSLDQSANFIGASAIKGRLIFKHQLTNTKGVLVITNER
jgi:hypothetical protein